MFAKMHVSARYDRGGQRVGIRMASCERQPVVVREGHKFFRDGLGVDLRRHPQLQEATARCQISDGPRDRRRETHRLAEELCQELFDGVIAKAHNGLIFNGTCFDARLSPSQAWKPSPRSSE
ncbi:hypothetical protein [Streptomyces scabiei]|uniref:hypothetical protein n=1 Tax=Streptomyces scabiei TaxID=1930 RepID=UPI000765A848|nr:hypothetical protein [Streptomyces scabiei]